MRSRVHITAMSRKATCSHPTVRWLWAVMLSLVIRVVTPKPSILGGLGGPTKPTVCYHHTKPQCTKNTQPLCTSVYAYYAGALLVKPNDSKPTDTNEEGRPKQSAMQTILGSGVWGRGSKRASKRPTPLIQPSFSPSHSLPNLPVSCRLFPLPMITETMCSFSDQLQIILESFGL